VITRYLLSSFYTRYTSVVSRQVPLTQGLNRRLVWNGGNQRTQVSKGPHWQREAASYSANSGARPSYGLCNSQLYEAGQQRDHKKVMQVWREMIQNKIVPRQSLANTIITALIEEKSHQENVRFLQEIRKRPISGLNVINCTRILQLFPEQPEYILEVLNMMREQKISVDSRFYNRVITLLTAPQFLTISQPVLEHIKQSKIIMDEKLMCTLILYFGRTASIEKVREIEKMLPLKMSLIKHLIL